MKKNKKDKNKFCLLDPENNRREPRPQRLIWTTEHFGLNGFAECMSQERRIDCDSLIASKQLFREIQQGKVQGLVCAAIQSNGKIDLIASGLTYDNPVIASGVTARLQAMLDGWIYNLD